MMDGLFVIWLKGHFQHPEHVVFKEDFVMRGVSGDGIESRVPARRV